MEKDQSKKLHCFLFDVTQQ